MASNTTDLTIPADDGWVSRAGVEHLLARITTHRDRSVWQISREEAQGKPLGHVGFFRHSSM